MRKANRRVAAETSDEVTRMQEKVKAAEAETEQLKRRCDKEMADRELVAKELKTLQQYLSEMPTRDELRKRSDDVSFVSLFVIVGK